MFIHLSEPRMWSLRLQHTASVLPNPDHNQDGLEHADMFIITTQDRVFQPEKRAHAAVGQQFILRPGVQSSKNTSACLWNKPKQNPQNSNEWTKQPEVPSEKEIQFQQK